MFGKVRKLGMKNEGGFWEKGNRVAGPCTAIQMNPRAVGRSKNPRGEGARSNPRSFEGEGFPYIQPNWGEGDCPPGPPGSDGPATHGRAVTLHSKSGRKTLVVTLMTIACLRQFSTEKQHIAVRK